MPTFSHDQQESNSRAEFDERNQPAVPALREQPNGIGPVPWASAEGGTIHRTLRRTADHRAPNSDDPLGGQAVPVGVMDTLRRRRGTGSPLASDTLGTMSEQFGTDLSAVRIHQDSEANQVADSMQSVAFTHGRDVYFSRGAYDDKSAAGQRLLAHELAHVTTPETSHSAVTTIGRADDPAERAADAVADHVVDQLRRSTAGAPGHPSTASAAGLLDAAPAGRAPADAAPLPVAGAGEPIARTIRRASLKSLVQKAKRLTPGRRRRGAAPGPVPGHAPGHGPGHGQGAPVPGRPQGWGGAAPTAGRGGTALGGHRAGGRAPGANGPRSWSVGTGPVGPRGGAAFGGHRVGGGQGPVGGGAPISPHATGTGSAGYIELEGIEEETDSDTSESSYTNNGPSPVYSDVQDSGIEDFGVEGSEAEGAEGDSDADSGVFYTSNGPSPVYSEVQDFGAEGSEAEGAEEDSDAGESVSGDGIPYTDVLNLAPSASGLGDSSSGDGIPYTNTLNLGASGAALSQSSGDADGAEGAYSDIDDLQAEESPAPVPAPAARKAPGSKQGRHRAFLIRQLDDIYANETVRTSDDIKKSIAVFVNNVRQLHEALQALVGGATAAGVVGMLDGMESIQDFLGGLSDSDEDHDKAIDALRTALGRRLELARRQEIPISPEFQLGDISTRAVSRDSKEEQEQSKVTVRGGLLCRASGEPVDTAGSSTFHSGLGAEIFVASTTGTIHMASHKIGKFHHSSLLAADEVSVGGEMKVNAGQIEWISNKSGHYRPTKEHLVQFVHWLGKDGIDLTTVKISGGWGVPGGIMADKLISGADKDGDADESESFHRVKLEAVYDYYGYNTVGWDALEKFFKRHGWKKKSKGRVVDRKDKSILIDPIIVIRELKKEFGPAGAVEELDD